MPPSKPSTLQNGENPKITLAAQVLRHDGTLQLKAWGVSMLPSLWPGDVLTVQSIAPNEIVPGEIVLVLRNHRFFVHRVVEKRCAQDSITWITRGDAMPHNDPPASAFDLLGRVTEVRRGNKSFAPARRISLLNATLGRVLCRAGRVRNLMLGVRAEKTQSGPMRNAVPASGSFELPASSSPHP